MRCTILAGLAFGLLASAQSNFTDQAVSLMGSEGLTGSSLAVDAFDITMIANTSHVLITLNASTPVNKFGWAALGVGTKMVNADMLVAWPVVSANNITWIVSHREASGHSMPLGFPTGQTASDFHIHTPLSTLDRSEKFTIVSIIRKLKPSYPTDATNVNLAQSSSQNIIWAYATVNPKSTDYAGMITQHNSYGQTKIDLSQTISAPTQNSGNSSQSASPIGVPVKAENSQPWTSHDTIIAIHAVVGCLAWLVIAPASVLIARLGRKLPSWLLLHRIGQALLTASFTLITVIFGVIAVNKSGSAHFDDSHKIIGLLLLIAVLLQIGFGSWIHHKYDAKRTKRPLRNIGHIFIGLALLILGFVEVYKGFNIYKEDFQRFAPGGIYALYYIIVAAVCLAILFSVGVLIQQRKLAGNTWAHSTFGLGRTSPLEAHTYPMMSRTAPGGRPFQHIAQQSSSTINSLASGKY